MLTSSDLFHSELAQPVVDGGFAGHKVFHAPSTGEHGHEIEKEQQGYNG